MSYETKLGGYPQHRTGGKNILRIEDRERPNFMFRSWTNQRGECNRTDGQPAIIYVGGTRFWIREGECLLSLRPDEQRRKETDGNTA